MKFLEAYEKAASGDGLRDNSTGFELKEFKNRGSQEAEMPFDAVISEFWEIISAEPKVLTAEPKVLTAERYFENEFDDFDKVIDFGFSIKKKI